MLFAEVSAGRALRGPDAARLRRCAALRRGRRLCAVGVRAVQKAVSRCRGPNARAQRARRAPAPHEHRHHRRGAAAEGALRRPWRRQCSARSRRYFVNGLTPWRHLHVRRQAAALRPPARHVLRSGRRRRRRAEGAGLRRRAHAADDQPRRPRARHAARSFRRGARFPRRCRNGCACSRRAHACPAARPAGGDVSARRPLVPGRLLLRGPQRAPDAGHAADAADGARGPAAARLRRHRLRAGGLERARAAGCGGVVRPGDARRRSGGVDGGKLHAAPHVPQRRRHRRADRAAPSRARKNRGAR